MFLADLSSSFGYSDPLASPKLTGECSRLPARSIPRCSRYMARLGRSSLVTVRRISIADIQVIVFDTFLYSPLF